MTVQGIYKTNTNDMRAVHAVFRSAFDFDLAYALTVGAGTDPARVASVASFYENVLEFLHVHHEGEDELVYPVLEQRCPEHAGLLSRIQDQHTLLDKPMADAKAAIEKWRSTPTAETGARVVRNLSAVDQALRPHLTDEEDEVLPIASAYLAPEEWAQLPGHALQSFACDKPWLALGLVRENLTEQQRSEMLAGMPPPLRQLWTETWEPAFTAFMAEVRRIAPAA